MIGFISSIFGSILGNPMMILMAIGVFFATSWISDIQGFFERRSTVQPYVLAIQERDKAVARKDRITKEALTARDNHVHELALLRSELDAAEIARKTQGVADCHWSDSDLRLLNTGD